MKQLLTLLVFFFTFNHLQAQTLKTFTGPIESSRPHGLAKYTYYEDPDTYKRIISGPYSYSYSGQDAEPGFKLTITGNYVKGLKNGNWTYAITMTDYEYGSDYKTGTITITGAYLDGYAHGTWKEARSIKTRTKRRSYGKDYWDPYTETKTLSIQANFNQGILTGTISVLDEFSNFKLSGKLNADGLADGPWIIRDYAWGQYKDLIYKEGILYETVFREQDEQASGVYKYHDIYDKYVSVRGLNTNEREDQGVQIDTVCTEKCAAASYLIPYYNKLFTTDYFPFHALDGDFTFSKGINGCCELVLSIQVKQPITQLTSYHNANVFKNEEKWLDAYEQLLLIDQKTLTSADKRVYNDEMILLKAKINETLNQLSEQSTLYNQTIHDIDSSSRQAYKALVKQFKVKNITAYNPSTYQTEIKAPIPISDYCTCKEPWNERYLEDGLLCIQSNKAFFEPYHQLVIQAFIDLTADLTALDRAVDATKKLFIWNTKDYILYNFNKNEFESETTRLTQPFKRAITIAHEGCRYEQLLQNVSDAYTQEKKKTLLKKYNVVAQAFQQKYQTGENTEQFLQLIKEFNAFQQAYLTHYRRDSKELEKQLKDLETVDEITKAILNQ